MYMFSLSLFLSFHHGALAKRVKLPWQLQKQRKIHSNILKESDVCWIAGLSKDLTAIVEIRASEYPEHPTDEHIVYKKGIEK